MGNLKEEFGLAEKPKVEGIITRDGTITAVDDYSREVLEKQKGEPEKRQKAVNKKVDAFKVHVTGNVRKGESMEPYSVEVIIPVCEDAAMQYHIQRFVTMELMKAGKLYDGVLNRSIEDIEETKLELAFIGKDVFSLSKDEIQYACDYYDIMGCSYSNPSIRTIQREFYMKYALKTDSSLVNAEKITQQEFISKVESTLDYKKLPKMILAE